MIARVGSSFVRVGRVYVQCVGCAIGHGDVTIVISDSGVRDLAGKCCEGGGFETRFHRLVGVIRDRHVPRVFEKGYIRGLLVGCGRCSVHRPLRHRHPLLAPSAQQVWRVVWTAVTVITKVSVAVLSPS